MVKTCQQCSAEFAVSKKGRPPKWCSPKCANRAWRRRKNPTNFGPKPCAVCETIFERQMPAKSKRTCSTACANILCYRENKAKRDAKTNEWHAAHKDRRAGYVAKCHKAKPEQYKLLRRVTEARRRSRYNGSYTVKEWKNLLEFYGNVCLCCGLAKPLHADHVIPLSKGGTNVIGNIQPLCKSCNSAKSTKSTDYRPMQLLRAS